MKVGMRVALPWAAVIFAGCGGSMELEQPSEPEVISLSIPLKGDVCGVTSANAFVTAWDMSPFGPVELQVTDAAITGTVPSVPAGSGRKVRVRAFNQYGLEVYVGATDVTVEAGRAVSAHITLYRNATNCPINGSTGDIDITGTLDTGVPNGDGGTPPRDGGSDVDGGSPPRDGGSGGDGGWPPRDGGSPPRDGGSPPRDGGSPPRDGGSDVDGGSSPRDGGKPDGDGGTVFP